MRKLAILLVPAAIAASVMALRPATDHSYSAVEGVWESVEVTVTTSDSTYTNEVTQPNLLVITKQHFAAMFIVGAEPRPQLPDEPSDELLLAAWRPFRANAGTYEVSGSEMTSKVIVSKNPNSTAEQREYTSAFELEGDVMHRTFTSGTTGDELRVKYVRVE